jgi:serine/threonine protein kinase
MSAPRAAYASAEVLLIPRAKLSIDAKQIGRGGFGTVFHAVWRGTEHVAVKKLHASHLDERILHEFQEEVSFLHALPYHPNVLQIHGVCVDEDNGTYLMVTEWMAGGALFNFLKSSASKALPLSRRVAMCIQAAMGIRHLHDITPPVLHRDIKSLNFLMDAHGDVKVGMCALHIQPQPQRLLCERVAKCECVGLTIASLLSFLFFFFPALSVPLAFPFSLWCR